MGLSSDPIGRLRQLADQQGDVASFTVGDHRCYLLSSPSLVQRAFLHADMHKRQGRYPATCLLGRGLMTSEGESNQAQRKLLRPLFGAGQRHRWRPIMQEQLAELTAGWRAGQEIRSFEVFGRLSMAVASRVLFDQRLPEEAFIQQRLEDVLQDPLSPVRADLDPIADRLLRSGRGPLVELLLSQPLADELRRDEIVTMLLGAHETTATTIALTMRMMALYGSQGSPHQLVAETLRLYPPGWLTSRVLDSSIVWEGIRLEGPCTVLLCPMVTHYLPDVWEDPHQFRTQRPQWAPQNRPESGSFFPFGGGRRVCIGESLAWEIAEEAVEQLRQNWVLQPVVRGPVPLRLLASLRPACGLPARLLRR